MYSEHLLQGSDEIWDRTSRVPYRLEGKVLLFHSIYNNKEVRYTFGEVEQRMV